MKDGVHQGSPISPSLFNIYLEEAINTMKKKFKKNRLWYKLYADDVVLILKASKLELFLKILSETAQEFNLILNKKKSAII